MEGGINVKSLKAKFDDKPFKLDTNNLNSGSLKSPQRGVGRAIVPVTESQLAIPVPITLPSLSPVPGPLRLPQTDPPRTAPNPRLPPNSGVRSTVQLEEVSRVKQTGEMLQNMMLKQQRTPGAKPGLALPLAPAASSGLLPPRQNRQRSAGDVTPLRRPLPPEGPLPLKPKRPPNVNLEHFLRFKRGAAPPVPRNYDAGGLQGERRVSLPTVINPPRLPQRVDKPRLLPRQVASVDFEDEQDPYDDIASFEKSESCSDNRSHFLDKDDNDDDDDDDDDTYEVIDEDQKAMNTVATVAPVAPEKLNKKEAKKQQEQEKKEKMLQQKKQNELKKNFGLQGEVEVLHTARARHDWHGGGKLDLSVRQGESVEILRLKNNPEGKWLARSLTGNYGYISNTCVDIDYEAIKRKSLCFKKRDMSPLPPPPPDPPQLLKLESNNRNSSLLDDGDYDEVQPILDEFPPPPSEIINDPKVEKELRKKFKYEGPLRVLHTMMVDPNCIIKKPGGKDLHVAQGEVLEIIHLTDSKRALCRNSLGKYGFVSRSYLLPMEGEIYDDVDYAVDVYDNDPPY